MGAAPQPRLPLDRLYLGDCLALLPKIKTASVHMVLADLPYAQTRNEWDKLINPAKLWPELKRITMGAIVLTAVEPFTSMLIMYGKRDFRYRCTWYKVNRCSGFLNAKKQPLRWTEDVIIFCNRGCKLPYYPIMESGKPYKCGHGRGSSNYGKQVTGITTTNDGSQYYPKDLIVIPANESGTRGRVHPTQKPVDLFAYLIETYTRPGELVLDPVIGSGTTALAARLLDRRFIGFEDNLAYYQLAKEQLRRKTFPLKRNRIIQRNAIL